MQKIINHAKIGIAIIPKNSSKKVLFESPDFVVKAETTKAIMSATIAISAIIAIIRFDFGVLLFSVFIIIVIPFIFVAFVCMFVLSMM